MSSPSKPISRSVERRLAVQKGETITPRRLEEQQRAVRLAQARLDEVTRDLAVAARKVERLQEERIEAMARLRAAAHDAGDALTITRGDAADVCRIAALLGLREGVSPARVEATVKLAVDVVALARELNAYDWGSRLDDSRTSENAKNDARELSIAVWLYDQKIGEALAEGDE
jgi:hypothetical protein